MRGMLIQFAKFAMVGALGTGVHYALMFTLIEAVDWPAEAATTLGAACGAGVNYLLNYRFTFRSSARHPIALTKFVAVAAIGLLINAAIVAALTRLLALDPLPAQLAATAVVLAWGFLANRTWTFGAGR
ncbi:MAG: GtrA family protein [Terricaulis sp.]